MENLPNLDLGLFDFIECRGVSDFSFSFPLSFYIPFSLFFPFPSNLLSDCCAVPSPAVLVAASLYLDPQVLSHLADPMAGLALLGEALTPTGGISFNINSK